MRSLVSFWRKSTSSLIFLLPATHLKELFLLHVMSLSKFNSIWALTVYLDCNSLFTPGYLSLHPLSMGLPFVSNSIQENFFHLCSHLVFLPACLWGHVIPGLVQCNPFRIASCAFILHLQGSDSVFFVTCFK